MRRRVWHLDGTERLDNGVELGCRFTWLFDEPDDTEIDRKKAEIGGMLENPTFGFWSEEIDPAVLADI